MDCRKFNTSFTFSGLIKKCLIIVVLTFCISVIILFYGSKKITSTHQLPLEEYQHATYDTHLSKNAHKYLVNSTKCKILDLDPFDDQVKPFHIKEKYISCSDKELLTYVTKNVSVTTLYINSAVLQSYDDPTIVCCYSEITRSPISSQPDDYVNLSTCIYFKDSVILGHKPIKVICESKDSAKIIYENVHAPVTITKDVQAKLAASNKFSVLLIGIDSISRLNFIRSLPKSYIFLMNNDWISFKGYNKIDDNTYPNVMAILTGHKQHKRPHKCKYNTVTGLNKCPLIWNDFRNAGYVTAFAEDEVWIATFNLYKKGFKDPPTDYYFRPYFIAAEKKLKTVEHEGVNYCTGPETTGERMFNLIKDFTSTFKIYPNFSLFWMNSFSHNSLNAVSMMDDKILDLLTDITNNGILDNTFIFFLSDHGLREGEFRDTSMGWLEERLPFFFLWVPYRFRDNFPNEYLQLKGNANKLINPYDLYMTLQHLLTLSETNYIIKQSIDCPKCKSLFTEIESERSCEDAGIEQHWCTCTEYNPINQNSSIIQTAAVFVIAQIHKIIREKWEDHSCANYTLGNVIASSIALEKYILVVIETQPKAVFESTILYQGNVNNSDVFRLQGEISRIDKYSPHSYCVEDNLLGKYCYCV